MAIETLSIILSISNPDKIRYLEGYSRRTWLAQILKSNCWQKCEMFGLWKAVFYCCTKQQPDSWQEKRIYTPNFIMRCDNASPRRQADFQWECWKEISKGVDAPKLCDGVVEFCYINVALIRMKVQKLLGAFQPIGNGIFYCNLHSSGYKIFYQQISKECISQIRMLQSLALCSPPLFFPKVHEALMLPCASSMFSCMCRSSWVIHRGKTL